MNDSSLTSLLAAGGWRQVVFLLHVASELRAVRIADGGTGQEISRDTRDRQAQYERMGSKESHIRPFVIVLWLRSSLEVCRLSGAARRKRFDWATCSCGTARYSGMCCQ